MNYIVHIRHRLVFRDVIFVDATMIARVYACIYHHIGETHHIKERSYSHVYKYMEKDSVGPKRSKQETLKHMKQAFSSNSIVSI